MKKPSLGLLKRKAWKLCSEYIRRRATDLDGNTECVACGKVKHWKKFQAGHLVQGRHLGILFDERGIWPCCYGCNIGKHGNYREYDAFIDNKFGRGYRLALIDDLRRLSKEPTKWTREQYYEPIEIYKGKLLQLQGLNAEKEQVYGNVNG